MGRTLPVSTRLRHNQQTVPFALGTPDRVALRPEALDAGTSPGLLTWLVLRHKAVT